MQQDQDQKKLIDSPEVKEITDLFLSTAGMESIRKVSLMAQPRNLEEMDFEEIRKLIMEKIMPKKKLIIAERTRFMGIKQEPTESIQSFCQRLREGARYCEFHKLGAPEAIQSAEDDLIQMRLIDGLINVDHRCKVLEQVQISDGKIILENCVQLVQQLEMISEFSRGNVHRGVDDNIHSVAYTDKNKPRMPSDRKQNSCRYCGYHHERGRCPAYGKMCNVCMKKNHFSKVCSKINSNKREDPTHHIGKENVLDIENSCNIYSICQIKNRDKYTMRKIMINNLNVKMQLDTGSEATLIPSNFWEQMGRPLLGKTTIKLRQYDGSVIETLGKFTTNLETEQVIKKIEVIVAKCQKEHGLIGTDVLNINSETLDINSNATSPEDQQIGCLKGFKARLLLRDNARPSYYEAREIPIHLKAKVITKLQLMISQGILEKVKPGGSRWASPIVIVRKPDGDVRICSDYKIGVNDKLCSDSFPIPRIETAFSVLSGMKYFAKFDLTGAYNQLSLDESSREITTINTPIGLLRWTRLPYGVKTASAQFQAAMEATLCDNMQNRIIYQDDIAIGAESEEELEAKVCSVLKTLNEAGMRINRNKCVFRTKSISFLGHVISDGKVSPDSNLVKKILSVQQPKDKKALASFLGLINFYGRYINNLSNIIEPLQALRDKMLYTVDQSLHYDRTIDL